MKNILDCEIESKKAYRRWVGIFNRCYSEKYLEKRPTYIGCSVDEEWKYFSSFQKWFIENDVEGYQLDKDILVQGNKIYGPKFCCFVPSQINSLFTKRDSARGDCVLGVQCVKRKDVNHVNYRAVISNHLVKKLIQYDFRNERDAYNCYVKMKLEYIKEVADYYKDVIAPNVYEALLKYTYDDYDIEKERHNKLYNSEKK